jgi:hydrophobe/amphiphile efflux-3 (HAE3) family protein
VARPFLFLLERHPRVLAFALLSLSVVALIGSRRLRFNDVPEDLFRTDGEDYAILERVQRDFSTDDNDALIVVDSTEHLFNARALRGFRQLLDDVDGVEGVESVLSMASVPRFAKGVLSVPRPMLPKPDASAEVLDEAREAAIAHPLVGGVLLSSDGRTALVVVRLAGERLEAARMHDVLADVRVVCDRVSTQSGFRCLITGVPAVRASILTAMRRDGLVFTIGGALLSTMIGLLLFRRWSATIIASSGPLVGLLWTFGILGFAGLEIDPISTVLPTLVLVIGFADSVHLGLDMREQRLAGVSRRDAALDTLRRLALPCWLTSLTTAIGFGSLCVASIPSIRHLGFVTAIGSLTTFVAVLTVVPFLASTRLGENIVPKGQTQCVDKPLGRWGGLLSIVVRWPRTISVVGVAVTALLLWQATSLRVDTKLTESVPSHFEAYEGIVVCDRAFGGVLEAQILVEWDESEPMAIGSVLKAIEAARDVAARIELFGKPLSVIDILASGPGTAPPTERGALLMVLSKKLTGRFLRQDLGRALVRLRVPDVYATESRPSFDRISAGLAELEDTHPGFSFRLTGTVVVVSGKVKDMIGDLLKSLGVAALVIFLVLAVAFRSIVVGLISLVPNVFPMAVTAAVIVAMGWPLVLGNVIVFSVCLGIAVDDTIHFIASYRRQLAKGMTPSDAIARSFVKVGRAFLATTIIFVAGFGCTLLSEMTVLRTFGSLACVAISSALIGDLVVLPALLLWRRRDSD